MTVVVGTAGHIDHGKTTLLRALTGIDADRLPEERRRGMTIDVGYAHLALPDGTELDFVDVPGPRPAGRQHARRGRRDRRGAARRRRRRRAARPDARAPRAARRARACATGSWSSRRPTWSTPRAGRRGRRRGRASCSAGPTLAGAPVARRRRRSTGAGSTRSRAALVELRDRVAGRSAGVGAARRGSRLAIDRVFAVKGRGAGRDRHAARRAAGARTRSLRLVPGDRTVRVREVQVHGAAVERRAGRAGRRSTWPASRPPSCTVGSS